MSMSKLCSTANAVLKARVSPIVSTRSLALRRFSSEGDSQLPAAEEDASVDPFLRDSDGFVCAKLSGIARHTLKTDIINFFRGCELSKADVKVEYNNVFTPLGMVLKFRSPARFDSAVGQSIRKGRLYRLEKVDCSAWDLLPSYDGKSVLLMGIPRAAFQEDIERLLAGTDFDPNFQIFVRGNALKSALVQFPTANDAMNAYRTKNHGFCLNNLIQMRVLQ